MNNIWDERYQTTEFLYGKEPNAFFEEQLNKLKPGKVLIAAEGEGRNAVFAAKLGWQVQAFDLSVVAKQKAEAFALEEKVSIDYDYKSVTDLDYKDNYYDCVAAFFMHLPNELQQTAFESLISKLKKGGTFILEVFSTDQLKNNSGGPKDVNLLYSKEDFENWFQEFSTVNIEQGEVILNEGLLHQGKADTIRIVAVK